MKHVASLLAVSLLVTPAVTAQNKKVIPAHCQKLEGLSNHRLPFTYSISRLQQIIDGPAVGTNIALINGIAWRRDALITSSFPQHTWNYQIVMHETPVSPAAMTSTYAANRGPNAGVTVFNGAVNIPAAAPAFPTPNPFSIVVPLSSPFRFLTANGHLLVEVIGTDTTQQTALWSPDAEVYDVAVAGKSQAVSPACTGAQQETLTTTVNNATAVLGGSLAVTWTPRPTTLTPCVAFIGTSNTTFSGIPLPLDLASAGMPGCLLGTNIVDLQVAATSPITWPIPNDAALDQLTLFTQAAVVAPAANAGGLILSWVLQVRIGGPANPPPVFQTVFNFGDNSALTGSMSVAGLHVGTVLELDGTFN